VLNCTVYEAGVRLAMLYDPSLAVKADPPPLGDSALTQIPARAAPAAAAVTVPVIDPSATVVVVVVTGTVVVDVLALVVVVAGTVVVVVVVVGALVVVVGSAVVVVVAPGVTVVADDAAAAVRAVAPALLRTSDDAGVASAGFWRLTCDETVTAFVVEPVPALTICPDTGRVANAVAAGPDAAVRARTRENKPTAPVQRATRLCIVVPPTSVRPRA
jgi:hypothetical protein